VTARRCDGMCARACAFVWYAVIVRYYQHAAGGVSKEVARQGATNGAENTCSFAREQSKDSIKRCAEFWVCCVHVKATSVCECVRAWRRSVVRLSVRWLIIRYAVIAQTEESMCSSNHASFACECVQVVPPTLCDKWPQC
jgi:hypothetical protein